MPSIGGIACTFVRGDAPLPKQRVMLWHVPGIDGYGAQRMGLGDSEFQFRCIAYGTVSAVGAWAIAVQALQGQLVTIVNDWGTSYPRCLICRASPPRYTTAKIGTTQARGEIIVEGVVT
jgi:hypothetical protein